MKNIRVRFAPSPTGPLHIGGVRTALYNYLLAKKHQGAFVLRIEDTDRTRYVEGAEEYIKRALEWFGMSPDEGVDQGGAYGPYRQSDRKEIYRKYVDDLVAAGRAYIAFDTPEEIQAMREREQNKGVHSPKYDASTRMTMRNSLTLSAGEVTGLQQQGTPYVVRLLVEPGRTVEIEDLVRGSVRFDTTELDDKVLLKGDGMPTYHLANIVDDHLMEITHVIRGEEWLSSTAHHVLLYEAFGWKDSMPSFAHLPLILKPSGKGKLSKRDGAKFGFPVFPLAWDAGEGEEAYLGFKEAGFLPDAVINFLAFLGWNPGGEREIFTLSELVEVFDPAHIVKSGARFDYEKALWFNQQHIMRLPDDALLEWLRPGMSTYYADWSEEQLKRVIPLMKERIKTRNEFYENTRFFFSEDWPYEEKMIRKKWKEDSPAHLQNLLAGLKQIDPFEAAACEATVKTFISENGLSFGAIMPLLRIGLTGTLKGPDLFQTMEILGRERTIARLERALEAFPRIKG